MFYSSIGLLNCSSAAMASENPPNFSTILAVAEFLNFSISSWSKS